MIPPNKTSTGEFQLRCYHQKERLIGKETMDGVWYWNKGDFIKHPTSEQA